MGRRPTASGGIDVAGAAPRSVAPQHGARRRRRSSSCPPATACTQAGGDVYGPGLRRPPPRSAALLEPCPLSCRAQSGLSSCLRAVAKASRSWVLAVCTRRTGAVRILPAHGLSHLRRVCHWARAQPARPGELLFRQGTRRREACGAVRALLCEGEMAQFLRASSPVLDGLVLFLLLPNCVRIGPVYTADWASHLELGGFFDHSMQ